MVSGLRALAYSVVRILGRNATYAGLGYRASPDYVITCAHVAAAALGVDPTGPEPAGEVLLDVPFASLDDCRVQVPAAIVPGCWLPKSNASDVRDLALLEVKPAAYELPLPGKLAVLDPAISLTGKPFDAYGGSEGHERNLIHLEGRIRAQIANGCWQLSLRDSDYPIEPGCSGAPAVDSRTGMVVGLIAQDERDPQVAAGFLIPATKLRMLLRVAGPRDPQIPGLGPLRFWLDTSLSRNVPALADPVRRFIDYYAGAPERPMPFAGRAEDLTALDGRFADGTGTFVLVSGSAGLGKSALLLHWMARQLLHVPNLRLLFLPISIRFDTAEELRGLRVLHAQLAGLFPEVAFPEDAKPDPEDYRDRIAAAWQLVAEHSDERFLLVVDGADEASGFWLTNRVLPYVIPSNLTQVIAARHKPGHHDGRAWLDDFPVASGCTMASPLELRPLPREAVREAIAQLGRPLDSLPEREGVLDELYRLTDHGDPLLVGLWVGQLWKARDQARHLRTADLARLKPGYGGFVDVWFHEQIQVWKAEGIEAHADDARRLLWVMALARGPLRLRDWLGVAHHLPVWVGWDHDTARRVLESTYRLVVGDAEQGYAFVHPRLADHFQSELDAKKGERRIIDHAYLAWGAAVVAALNGGVLRPEQCSTYLLRHYTTHVAAAEISANDALDKHLLPVLERGWLQAWEEEGGYSGYLADVLRAEEMLHHSDESRAQPPYRLGAEIRCVLIRASIRMQTARLWPDLVLALVETRVWTVARAAKAAGEHPNAEERAGTLVLLADRLAGDARVDALAQAVAAARIIDDHLTRARILAAVAPQVGGREREELLHEALEAARTIRDEWSRAEALAAVARRSAGETKLLRDVVEAARDIHETWRAQVLMTVTKQSTGEPDVLGGVLGVAREFGDAALRAEALAAVSEQLERNEGRAVLEEALATARGIGYGSSPSLVRASVLAAVANMVPEEERRGILDEALAAVEGVRGNECTREGTRPLPQRLSMEELVERLKDAGVSYGQMRHKNHRAQAPSTLDVLPTGAMEYVYGADYETCRRIGSDVAAVARLPYRERRVGLSRALAAARDIGNVGMRREVLATAVQLVAGDRELLQELLVAVSYIGDERFRAEALADMARQLSGDDRREALREALDAVSSIPEEQNLARCLGKVAVQLAGDPELSGETLRAIRGIRSDAHRAAALCELSPHLTGQPQLTDVALAIAQGISHEGYRAAALASVAGPLPAEARRKQLADALTTALGIGEVGLRAEALAYVAKHLAGERDLLKKALRATSLLGRDEWIANTLAAVASQLSGEPDLQREALGLVRFIGSARLRAEPIAELAKHFAGSPELLRETLTAVRVFPQERYRGESLAALAKHLAGESELLTDALNVARRVMNERRRAEALAAIAQQLATDEQGLVLEEALTTVRGIRSNEHRARALLAVVPRLRGEPDLLRQALTVARGIRQAGYRAMAIAVVAKQFDTHERPNALREAVETARNLRTDATRAEALVAVATEMAEEPELLQDAINAMRTIKDPARRADALVAATAELGRTGYFWAADSDTTGAMFRYQVFACLLGTAGDLPRDRLFEVVGLLAPAISVLGGAAEVQRTADAIRDIGSWWP